MAQNTKTLVVGGYGHVGLQVARALTSRGKSVVLAGRNGERAKRVASSIGAEGRSIDLANPLTWSDALDEVQTVLVCLDSADASFARYVLDSGRHYVDISATDSLFRSIETLDDIAQSAGSTAILSVGLAPGLTNLLVADAARRLHAVSHARIGILMGSGDAHGEAAIAWVFRELAAIPSAPSLTKLSFERRGAPVVAGPFPFADQYVVQRTLGLPHCETLLSMDPPLLTRSMYLLRRSLRFKWLQKVLTKVMQHFRVGSDRCALTVEAVGTSSAGERQVVRHYFDARDESRITASVAVGVLTALDTQRRSGVHHIEQHFSLAEIAPFVEAQGGAFDLGSPEPQ